MYKYLYRVVSSSSWCLAFRVRDLNLDGHLAARVRSCGSRRSMTVGVETSIAIARIARVASIDVNEWQHFVRARWTHVDWSRDATWLWWWWRWRWWRGWSWWRTRRWTRGRVDVSDFASLWDNIISNTQNLFEIKI